MAIDWTRGMSQTFRYAVVDPLTWLDREVIAGVSSCTITRDVKKQTFESASLEVDGDGWLGAERVVRCYMDVAQGDEVARVCMGTFAFQGARATWDVGRHTNPVDGYGLLQDMAQDSPPFGYCVSGDPSAAVGELVAASCRAPFVGYDGLAPLAAPVWANDGDSWLTFALAVAAEAACTLVTDPYGRVTMVPDVALAALRPVWSYGTENCIVFPNSDEETDLFDVPNWCEVTVTNGTSIVVGSAENTSPWSPVSTVRRGHRVPLRLTNPDGLSSACTKADADAFAARQLADRSEVQRMRRYTHAWCPVWAGDAVSLAFDGDPVVARVETQEIRLKTGVEVEELASYSERVWSP